MSKRRHPQIKAPDRGRPEPPGWLSELQQRVFVEVLDRLDAMEAAYPTDLEALARYAVLLVRWREADQAIADNGWQYITDHGGYAMYPVAAAFLRIGPQLLRLEQEFGLTLASRTVEERRRAEVMPEPVEPDGEDEDRAIVYKLGGA